MHNIATRRRIPPPVPMQCMRCNLTTCTELLQARMLHPVRTTLRVVRFDQVEHWRGGSRWSVARGGRDRSLLGCSAARLLGCSAARSLGCSADRDRALLGRSGSTPPPHPLARVEAYPLTNISDSSIYKNLPPVRLDPIPTVIDPHAPHTAKTPPPSQEMGFWLWQYLKFFGVEYLPVGQSWCTCLGQRHTPPTRRHPRLSARSRT